MNAYVTGVAQETKSTPAINYDLIATLEKDKQELERSIKKEKYKCPHWEGGKRKSIVTDNRDVICEICGQTFKPEDVDPNDINHIINDMRNLIQTMVYINSEINHSNFPIKHIDLDMNKISDMLVFLDDFEQDFLEINNNFNTISSTGPAQNTVQYQHSTGGNNNERIFD